MNVKEKYYHLLKSGKKTIESRLNDEKRRQIKVGDEIEFTNESDKNDHFMAEVIALHLAPDFETLYAQSITPRQGGFDAKEELLSVLEEFYTPSAQKNTALSALK